MDAVDKMTIATSKPHLRQIDCLRGYAVLMVMTTHLTSVMVNLPYHVSRFTYLGWYGVQLFFLISAYTLLSSWNAEAHRFGSVGVRGFFVRRVLRIAPAYYIAAALYLFLFPPSHFDLNQLIASLMFVNSWSPSTMPTLAHKWTVVPGGWSVGVEFSFYAIFPILASAIDRLRNAAFAVVLAICVGIVFNIAALHLIGPTTPSAAMSNFLYFWLPDQLTVFILGMTLYYLIGDNSQFSIGALDALRPHRHWLAVVAIAIFLSASYMPMAHYIGQSAAMPEILFVSLAFVIFAAAVSSGPTLFVNRASQELGKVSFSAYLLHFAFLDALGRFPLTSGAHKSALASIATFALDWPILVAVTFLAALGLYRAIELPAMILAKRLTKRVAPSLSCVS